MPAYNAGAILDVQELYDDNGVLTYTVSQLSENLTLPKPVKDRLDARYEINWELGPFKVTGYVDSSTFEIGIEISVLGIQLGNFYGNLKDGLVVNIDLFLAKGKINFYLKNGKEVWVHVDVSITFDGSFNQDVKLLTLPI
ncbi:hypothetical protein MMC06_006580 [Schaereria dolodes]|nr:hypothetical protein [Schaereria dolodes]